MIETRELRERPLEPARHEPPLVPRRRGSLVAKGALAAAALLGLLVFVRELPDLRRYLRIERM